MHAADSRALNETKDAMTALEAKKKSLEDQVASLSAQLVAAQASSRERVEALEGQLRRSDTRVEELRQQNDLLLQQVTTLSDTACRPAGFDAAIAGLSSGGARPLDADTGAGARRFCRAVLLLMGSAMRVGWVG